jgi:hypothetical protein
MSDESAYFGMFLRVFDDLLDISPEYKPKDAERDREVCLSRYRCEGLSFLTKTLPALMKHLYGALESGTFVPIASFKIAKGRTTPCFLGSLFKEIFDEKGSLLDTAHAQSVELICQVCAFMYKFDADYPADLVAKVVKSFVDVDASLTHCETVSNEQRILLTVASSWLFRIFSDFDPADIRPRPGPGASASGTHKSRRYEPLTHYSRIHEQYPYYGYFYMGSDHLVDRKSAYMSMPRKEHGMSVLRTVPKDSRGPRIICMEEQEYMFLQQGLGDAMREHVMRHPLTRGHVNFDDQSINRRLAQESSVSREFATLDMKEASDRISRQLVHILFAKLPKLRSCLLALSTPCIKLPNGEVLDAKKFAPMGSSLCFPIMSVVHYALGVAAMHVATGRSTKALAKDLYVYGDDIIVRSEHVDSLFEAFPKFGLIFNQGKSFRRGHFRESCGMDAFRGRDVTPQRLKRRFFDGRDPRDILAVTAMHAALYNRGFVRTAAMLRTITDSRFGRFPFVGKGSCYIGWQTQLPISDDVISVIWDEKVMGIRGFLSRVLITDEDRAQYELLGPVWDSDTHCWTISARVMKTEPDASMSGGWEQMMRSNLEAQIGSARLDGRWKRQAICFQRNPYQALNGECADWLPS